MKILNQTKCLVMAVAMLTASVVFAGPGQIGSSENSIDAIERLRAESVKTYVVKQSHIKGSTIQKALENMQVTSLDAIQVVQTDQVINGHPVDSFESRAFLVVIPYLEGQSTNFDENNEYRSNTARFSSVLLQCELEAKSYRSQSVKISCLAK
ncbi:hypothetical protein AZI86_11385 [Bdellovibrio bacteriovorus]|uniref:Uncharacterized protein n=1 Tax=Bdellovibrio bacteriovorus TaxID=959 RepID=A0A150WLE3_BDEBC|nr:hypothetical protein [Bdellovibrio bacteriovorus]KYG64800.1 hypothetical protein AZI86_11385 [Bdellovibrio bacteriovorus]